jgi:hypothetical protein
VRDFVDALPKVVVREFPGMHDVPSFDAFARVVRICRNCTCRYGIASATGCR